MSRSTKASSDRTKGQPERLSYRELLWKYIRPEWPRALGLSLLLSVSISLQLYIPQLMRNFIDSAQAGQTDRILLGIAGSFLLIAFVRELFELAVTYMGQDLRWRTTNRMRADLTRHCLRLGMDFHNDQTPGKMIERVDGDVTALSNLLSDYFLRVISNVFVMLGVLLLLGREDARLGFAYAAFILISMWGLRRGASIAVPAWKESREASAELFGYLEERLAGTEDLRAAGAGPWVLHRFIDRLRDYMIVRRKANILGSAMWVASVALFSMGTVLALGLGGWLYFAGAISIGTVYLVYHYTEMLKGPIEQLAHQLEDIQRAAGGLERVSEILALRPPSSPDNPLAIPTGKLHLQFEDLEFAYKEGESVVSDINFELEEGQVLGLLGRTGSGKTTLSRLLLRLYEPTGGKILLGGVDIARSELADLRSRVGIVTQDVQLFNASVRENVRFFDSTIRDTEILAVLKDIGLGEWLARLPEGLDTELESGGKGISAGEAQLLAFARVFLKDPGLVIMDEASSRLDPATEGYIETAIDKLMANRTGIIIAHRLGTVRRCDQIVIMSDGRIVESGDRRHLLEQENSRFAQLIAKGLEGQDEPTHAQDAVGSESADEESLLHELIDSIIDTEEVEAEDGPSASRKLNEEDPAARLYREELDQESA